MLGNRNLVISKSKYLLLITCIGHLTEFRANLEIGLSNIGAPTLGYKDT